ncbi:MAG TPA: hypothetical protein EYG03_22545 [Planctomycetes bacterium]|nr:hypothetical protein [Fuerstiella sp.]HIK94734.1 hypothetical protein [Planctomycetota bacterium]
MRRFTTALLLMAAMSGLTGCAAICDGIISMEMDARNDVLALKAWGHWSRVYDDLDYPWHFSKGFKEGYVAVLNGGSGCQPTIPPQCYWKPCYQTLEGKNKIHAWFDGFSHGALAAKQDGYGDMGQIPISPTARANIEAARRRPSTNVLENLEQMSGTTVIDDTQSELLLAPEDSGDDPQVLPRNPDRPIQLRPYE